MSVGGFGNTGIVTDGLIYGIDPLNTKSYSGVGNTSYSLLGDGNTSQNLNGTSFDGSTFVYDGSNDYVQFGANQGLVTEWTYQIWVKFNTPNQTFRSLFNTGAFNATSIACFVHPDNRSISLYSYIGGLSTKSGGYSTYASSSYTGWQCFTFAGDVNNLYIWYDENSFGSSTRATSGDFTINNFNCGITMGYGYMNGSTSLTLLYNRVLTDDEVTQNVNSIKPRFR